MEVISKRNVACVLIGPLALVPALVLYGMVFKFLGPQDNHAWLQIAKLYFTVGIPIAYACVVLLGVPIGLVLDYFGKLKLAYLSAIAVALSAVIAPYSDQPIYAWLTTSYLSVSVVVGCWFVREKLTNY